jgi:hypothetical protein
LHQKLEQESQVPFLSIHGIIPFLVFDVGYMAVADDHPVRMALDVVFDEVIGSMEKQNFEMGFV